MGVNIPDIKGEEFDYWDMSKCATISNIPGLSGFPLKKYKPMIWNKKMAFDWGLEPTNQISSCGGKRV